MLIVERQEKLLAILRQRKNAEMEELARELDVSISTVRRDLETLESKGLIQRTHGGAIWRDPMALDGSSPIGHDALSRRMNEQVARKQAIGQLAASMVQPHMTLLMDGGSTIIYAARLIVARPIQVVTNSLAIAQHFADDDQVELTIVGGNLYPRTGVTLGPIANLCLSDLHADLLFYSLAGIYGDEAFNINMTMAETEQLMMRQAAKKILLMDSGKFGRKSLVRVCSLTDVDAIVTDEAVDPAWTQRLGSRLLVAKTGR